MADAPVNTGPQLQTPQKQYPNSVRTTGRAFNSPNWRMKREEEGPSSAGSRANDSAHISRGSLGGRSNGNVIPQAISEGRRLYVGNMPYTAKMEDVQGLFNAAGFETSRIDIAIDPFSGRNPSYCFVDLETKELAERAMNELDGSDLLGRPVKIKPGVVKSASERTRQRSSTGTGSASENLGSGSPRGSRTSPFNVDRWRRDGDAPAPATPSKSYSNTNTSSNGNADPSKRLYVGGLPRLADQESINRNITAFFKDYTLTNITKLFTPHPAKRFEPGDHYYLFVDFTSAEEAQSAMAALNGAEGPWGAAIRVQRARGETSNSGSREKEGLLDGQDKEKRTGGRWASSALRGNNSREGVVEA
ncbi:uncharacterized protein BJX67DRAFT_107077 [Aspergillus lucknowensis]|uniref:RRM domain-containing protein n=1 Tax=Aspergillus lucknowensis TaxID=176173 RepID=A0ABR4LRL8_9EURO